MLCATQNLATSTRAFVAKKCFNSFELRHVISNNVAFCEV